MPCSLHSSGQSFAHFRAMSDSEPQNLAHPAYLLGANRRAGRQNEHAPGKGVGNGEPPKRFGRVAAIRLHAVAAGIEVTARNDVLSFENLQHLISAEMGQGLIDL